MKAIIKFFFLLSFLNLYAGSYTFSISPINSEVKKRMIQGNSWKKNCPVGLQDLRYLKMTYLDFSGKNQTGEMIVHKDVAQDVTQIFESLYVMRYPIRKMRLVSDYAGDDYQSIEADNTSAFNCRHLTGNKKKWSNHAYGKAIDINPIENPYISRKGTSVHKASAKYLPAYRKKRNTKTASDRAVLLKNDKAVKLFKNYGWRWGGDWKYIKDYQHFDKNKEPRKINNKSMTKIQHNKNMF